MAHRLRQIAVAAVLIISTALWGHAVAGHFHLEQQEHPCDTCLLPHAANVGADTIAAGVAPPPAAPEHSRATSHNTPSIPSYQSRAPPR